MNLLRKVQHTYELLTASKIDDIAKSVWATVATVLWSLFRDDDNEFRSGFIGKACEPTADGSSSVVQLAPGLALFFEDDEADVWRGKLKPIFLSQSQPVDFATNQDSDDRIDSIFIRPVEEEEEHGERWFFDPIEKNEYQEEVAGRIRYDFETQVLEGDPAPLPDAPDTPDGWMRVADVDRPSGQVNVLADDVSDVREALELRLSAVFADIIGVETFDGPVSGPEANFDDGNFETVNTDESDDFPGVQIDDRSIRVFEIHSMGIPDRIDILDKSGDAGHMSLGSIGIQGDDVDDPETSITNDSAFFEGSVNVSGELSVDDGVVAPGSTLAAGRFSWDDSEEEWVDEGSHNLSFEGDTGNGQYEFKVDDLPSGLVLSPMATFFPGGSNDVVRTRATDAPSPEESIQVDTLNDQDSTESPGGGSKLYISVVGLPEPE